MRKNRSKLWLLFLAVVCSLLFSATAFAAIEVTMSGTSNYADAYEAFQATNEQRTKVGKKELNMNPQLQEAAMLRAWEAAMLVGHERPDGSAMKTAINVTYSYKRWGENIAYGYSSGSSVVNNGWMESEGHKANILRDEYTQVGIGCYVHNGTYYWAQIFTDGTCTSSVSKKANSPIMTRKVKIAQSNLQLWGSRADSVLCLRGQTIEIRQNVEEQLIPVHYNNEGYPVTLYAGDFTWLLSDADVETISIMDHSGERAFVKGLKTGMTSVSCMMEKCFIH